MWGRAYRERGIRPQVSFYLIFSGCGSRYPESQFWAAHKHLGGMRITSVWNGKIVNLSEIIKAVSSSTYSNLNIGCQQDRIPINNLNILLCKNIYFANSLNSWESETACKEAEEGWETV